MLWLAAGLVSCADVLVHLKLILMSVCLNKLVIFCMHGEEKVKVAHFFLFSVFLVGGGIAVLHCICCFSLCSKLTGKLLDVAM